MQVTRNEFYTTKEVAMRCGVSPRTVEGWRNNGLGPHYLYVGARIMYKVSDVDQWLADSALRGALALQERAIAYKARLMRQGAGVRS